MQIGIFRGETPANHIGEGTAALRHDIIRQR
jgi:hypothetical protein